MKEKIFYRIAAVLLLLFAVGHTVGFRQTDPSWHVDATVAMMKSVHFDVQGFNRTYWDFFVGFGLFVTVLQVFAAIVAWQLGSLPPETLRSVRFLTWAFAACFAVVVFLSWRYFFYPPVIFSVLIEVCLVAGAWTSGKPSAT